MRLITPLAVACLLLSTTLQAVGQTPARELTPQEQSLCRGDAIRLCFTSIGQADAMRSCLRRNKPNLSDGCKKLIKSRGG